MRSELTIEGIGWLDPDGFGSGILGQVYSVSQPSSEISGHDARVFDSPVKNFGRFDAASKAVCYAVGMALKDAAEASCDVLKKTGILGVSLTGALPANERFFADYLEGGRKLARGNLFVYTLPTSPLAETAIQFHIEGPVYYLGSGAEGLELALNEAAKLVCQGCADTMIAVEYDEHRALAVVLGSGGSLGAAGLCDAIGKAMNLEERSTALKNWITSNTP